MEREEGSQSLTDGAAQTRGAGDLIWSVGAIAATTLVRHLLTLLV